MKASEAMQRLRNMAERGILNDRIAVEWALDLIGRLPKDAEGNPVLEDETYYARGVSPSVGGAYWDECVAGVAGFYDDCYSPSPVDWAEYYPSKEAAEAALAKPKEGTTDDATD